MIFQAFLLAFLATASSQLCELDSPQAVPAEAVQDPAYEYGYFEAGLQIFDHYRIPCDGMLVQWRYMTPHSTFSKVYLGVFRRFFDSQGDLVFQLIARTYIKQQPKNWMPGVWYTAIVAPVQVKAGDYLGLFYDSLHTPYDQVLIPSKADESPLAGKTYVFLYDANTVAEHHGFVRGNYAVQYRLPAMYGVVDRIPEQQPEIPQIVPVPQSDRIDEPSTSSTLSTTTTTPTTAATTEAVTKMDNKPKLDVIAEEVRIDRGVRLSRCLQPSPLQQNSSTACVWLARRAYYNQNSGKCETFYGCVSSTPEPANNYDTLEACRAECPDAPQPLPPPIPIPGQAETTPAASVPLFPFAAFVPPYPIIVNNNYPIVSPWSMGAEPSNVENKSVNPFYPPSAWKNIGNMFFQYPQFYNGKRDK